MYPSFVDRLKIRLADEILEHHSITSEALDFMLRILEEQRKQEVRTRRTIKKLNVY